MEQTQIQVGIEKKGALALVNGIPVRTATRRYLSYINRWPERPLAPSTWAQGSYPRVSQYREYLKIKADLERLLEAGLVQAVRSAGGATAYRANFEVPSGWMW